MFFFINFALMSKILEEIYNGWKNLTFKSPEIEKLAKKRVQICIDCTIKEGEPGMRKNKTCKVCGCYIPAKVRSVKSKCPLKKW